MLKFIFHNFKGMVVGSITSVLVAGFWFAVDIKTTQATVETTKEEVAQLKSAFYTMNGKLDILVEMGKEERQLRQKKENIHGR